MQMVSFRAAPGRLHLRCRCWCWVLDAADVCGTMYVVTGRPMCRESNPTGQSLVISGQAPIVFV